MKNVFQRKGRLANEAAEIRKQLSHGRDAEREALAQSTLEAVSDSVLEALLSSAVAGVELLAMQEVSRREDRRRTVTTSTAFMFFFLCVCARRNVAVAGGR